jgi:E3 ubiquitin-protein ligase SIAH1
MESKTIKSQTQIETEMKKQLHNDLYDYLVCQKCQIVPKIGEIYVCAKNDHATCAACFMSTKVCKICKTAITTQSKVLEQLRTRLPISCKNRKNGCQTVLTLDSLVYHEIDCEWRPIFCPDLSCKAETVIFNTLDQHLTDNHIYHNVPTNQSFFFNGFNTVKEEYYSGNSEFWIPVKLSLKKAQFFCEVTLNQGRFYFWVYYHGSPENAKNYKYTIKIFNNGDEKFIYNATVRSLNESKETIIRDENALVISTTQVRRLVSNEKLKWDVQLWGFGSLF